MVGEGRCKGGRGDGGIGALELQKLLHGLGLYADEEEALTEAKNWVRAVNVNGPQDVVSFQIFRELILSPHVVALEKVYGYACVDTVTDS